MRIAKLVMSAVFLVVAGLLSAQDAVIPKDQEIEKTPEDVFLDELQEHTFRWFWETSNPVNGLVPDRAPDTHFSSVAATGFGLTAIPVGIERGYVTRREGIDRVLATLRFFLEAPQGTDPAGMTGYKGFVYHFLDMQNGQRFERVELSTIDTALLMMGVLFCQSYFENDCAHEVEIRQLADQLYQRVEWDWAVIRKQLIAMGWHPERGFIPHDYKGYDEAMFLYLLALGSPTHSIDSQAWNDFTETYHWERFQGQDHVNFAPLFGHQYTQVWLDMRGLHDPFMKAKGIDYFENSRRATLAQRAYAMQNPLQWQDYGPNIWGLTACDGPADVMLEYRGTLRQFRSYSARGAGADYINDDGTLSPTAAGGSVVFAPELVIPALMEMKNRYGDAIYNAYGFVDAFNPTFRHFDKTTLQHGKMVGELGWFDTDQLGIDQGPILLMIENYRSGMIWDVMKRNPYIITGLKRAGFSGGWMDLETPAGVATE